MDGPGTYSQPPYAGGSKDESGTAAKDTISIGSGDRVSGEDRMGMEVHGSADKKAFARMTEEITKIYGEVLGVKPDHMYIKYAASMDWGWNGGNF